MARVCVIGAGPSGLTAIKNLVAEGVTEIVCYEAQAELGGNWVFRDTTGHASVYETTHIISSKSLSQFADFPMPNDYPDFPSHRQILAYFQAYAARFGLERYIRYGRRVMRAARQPDGRWRVATDGPDGPEEAPFDQLIVCSGHHWDPVIPDYPGTFAGERLHAHDYRRAEPLRGKRVLVVGGGNSACDIAVETARVAAHTAISLRRGYHIIPKVVFGLPVDVAYRRLRALPKPLRQRLLALGLRLAIGRYRRYGLAEPERPPMELHPTLNTDILMALRHGLVHPRPGIAALEGERVRFVDGRSEAFDTIIWATGYRTSFPFLEAGVADWAGALELPLYLKMMPAEPANLYFIGLFQPIGCIWTLADLQARIAARHIAGTLPRPAHLTRRIAREMANPHWRFDRTPRHAIEVDYYDFEAALLGELAGSKAAA